MKVEQSLVWKLLFFTIVAGYVLYYAPFGVNETDGGFLTGLAWQILNGKVLYQDVIYIRPPMSVWLRALELQALPEYWAVLGERWFFYGKLALYACLGAAVLEQGARRWPLALIGFVVSAHCYPPMAWHTVDGILFAVLAAFFINYKTASTLTTLEKLSTFDRLLQHGHSNFLFLGIAGCCLFCSMLCKQSFYPLLPLFALYLFFEKANRWKNLAFFFGAFTVCTALFFNYLAQENIISGYLQMTRGATSGGQALQHGILDYFRITPELALPSIVLLAPVAWWFWKGKNPRLALGSWSFWLFALVLSYPAITWLRQEHTVPFAQSRVMFWVAAGLLLSHRSLFNTHRILFLLLGISWCAAVSWGYNLPILFATPWVWAGMEITRMLLNASKPIRYLNFYGFIALLVLLLSFRIGQEFVYRDGRRGEMTEPMGAIFSQLSGIYSDRETADLYRDLKQLSEQYGPNFKILPAFPQANFLTNTPPPLPLDWVVNRETNGDNNLIYKKLKEKKPVIFIQKSFQAKIETDPELEVTRQILKQGSIAQETPNFWVVVNYEL